MFIGIGVDFKRQPGRESPIIAKHRSFISYYRLLTPNIFVCPPICLTSLRQFAYGYMSLHHNVLYDCAKIAYTNLGTKEKTLHVAYFSYFLPVAVCNYLFTEALHKGLIGLSGAR